MEKSYSEHRFSAAIDFTSCYEKMQMTVPKSDPKQFYGSLNPFYSINKGIADGLQKQMDDSTLQDVYNLIAGTKGDKPSVGKVVNDVMKQQVGRHFEEKYGFLGRSNCLLLRRTSLHLGGCRSGYHHLQLSMLLQFLWS